VFTFVPESTVLAARPRSAARAITAARVTGVASAIANAFAAAPRTNASTNPRCERVARGAAAARDPPSEDDASDKNARLSRSNAAKFAAGPRTRTHDAPRAAPQRRDPAPSRDAARDVRAVGEGRGQAREGGGGRRRGCSIFFVLHLPTRRRATLGFHDVERDGAQVVHDARDRAGGEALGEGEGAGAAFPSADARGEVRLRRGEPPEKQKDLI
jgi:hypothetical protein